MGDTAAWCVAVVLVSAGVAADGYLAWMFIRDWRVGRAEERAHRARCRAAVRPARAAETNERPLLNSRYLRACAGLAAVAPLAALVATRTPAAQADYSVRPISRRVLYRESLE